MVAKNKFLSLTITFLILLMDFSAIGFIAINDGELLSELAGLKPPKLYMNIFNPLFKNFRNGTPVTIWEDKIIEKIVISPAGGSSLDLGKGLTLGSNVDKTWKTGINATGKLSKGLEKVFEGSVRNINDIGVLVLAFFATDIEFLNETLFSDERIRIVTDEVLRFAEEVGDVSIVLSGNYCTATNLIYLLKRSEENPKIREVYLIVLTHGILNETLQVHGMLMHDENGTAVVNGETLEHLAALYHLEKLRKLKFVYLPFCNMGREKEIYNEKSIVTFFEKHSEAIILTYDGEAYLNGDYIASLQTILSSGIYELIEEATYIPIQVIDNLTGETLDAYVEFRVEDEIEEVNSTINPYKIYDDNMNITLGFKPRRIFKFNGKYKATIHSKKVRAIICRGKPPKNRLNKHVIRIRHKVPPTYKKFGKKHNLNFKHKTRNIAPVIMGRFWKPPEIRKQQHINKNNYVGSFLAKTDEVKRAILLVDEIFTQIYSNYYSIKSAIYKWIDKTFNAPWNRWMKGPIKSTLDNSVFRGTSFIINFAKNHLKTIVCIAVHLKNTNKNLGELVAAIIIAAIAKNARGILKYFSWTMNKLLETLSKILSTDLGWVKKILNGWIDPNIKFLDNVVAYSEATFKSAAKKLAETIIKPFNWIWKQIKTLLNTLWSNFVDFSVDNYLTLAYLIAELAAERKISEKLAKSIINTAGKIIDFIISLQPVTERLKSWTKIYRVWFTAGLVSGLIPIIGSLKSCNEDVESWERTANRDVVKTNIVANGKPEKVYKILFKVLEDKVKHMSFIRTDDIKIVVWESWYRQKWFDALQTKNLINRIRNILENEDLKASEIIKFDEDGKIVEVTLDYEKNNWRYYRWLGEIHLVQVIHTHIDGKPVAFAVVWEGYMNWFRDPGKDSRVVEANMGLAKKHFSDQNKILISDFVPCRVETQDFTLKGFRIVVGVAVRVKVKPNGNINVRSEYPFTETYGKLVPSGLVPKEDGKFMYRFDRGFLGEDWKEKIEKVELLIKEQADVWNRYIEEVEHIKGKRPTLFDAISQTLFETHLTLIDKKVEGVVQVPDPPFLEEPPLSHVALLFMLENAEKRLESDGVTKEVSVIGEKRMKIENFIRNNYKVFYEVVYKKLVENTKDTDVKIEEKFATLKKIIKKSGPFGFVAVDKAKLEDHEAKVCAKREIYESKLKGTIPDEELKKGRICWEFMSLQPPEGIKVKGLEKKISGHVTRGSALAILEAINNKEFIRPYTEKRSLIPETIAQKILDGKIKEIGSEEWKRIICHEDYFNEILKSKDKVKSTFKNLLGKTIEKAFNAGTTVMFIAVFATTSFLGYRLGMEIYDILPENTKTTLRSGYGKIKVYMILACISFVLLNVDDYQDFINNFRGKKENGSIKDVVKVLLQTFLGCVINGMLLQMLIENKEDKIILADDVIPYISRELFGRNAWVFEKIIWPVVSTAIQVFANGGPVMYLAGITIGTTITQTLNKLLS